MLGKFMHPISNPILKKTWREIPLQNITECSLLYPETAAVYVVPATPKCNKEEIP
jgi:hypothetical protein